MKEETVSQTPVYLYQSAWYRTRTDRRLHISAILRRKFVRWDNSVGIATRYWLDARSNASIQTGPVQYVRGLFPGGKMAGAWG